jgi:hypothetical protein
MKQITDEDTVKPQTPKKNPEKLIGRFAQDFATMRADMLARAGMSQEITRETTRTRRSTRINFSKLGGKRAAWSIV